jgi:hypothetical protein
MNDMIDLSMSGSKNEVGKFGGTGQIILSFKDISKSSLTFDYSHSDKVLLKVDSSVGIKLSADNTLTFSGGLNYDFMNKKINGNIGAQFIISKNIAAKIEQSFATKGNTTALTLTIKI